MLSCHKQQKIFLTKYLHSVPQRCYSSSIATHRIAGSDKFFKHAAPGGSHSSEQTTASPWPGVRGLTVDGRPSRSLARASGLEAAKFAGAGVIREMPAIECDVMGGPHDWKRNAGVHSRERSAR